MATPTFYTKDELAEIENKINKYMLQNNDDLISNIKSSIDELEKNCMIVALIAKDADTNCFDEQIVRAYSKYPPFMFYTDKEYNASIKRIYGFATTDSGELRAHTVCAMSIFNNDTIGGTPVESLIHVKKWSDNQIDRLKSGLISCPEAFLEQNGYMRFAR